MNAKTLKTIRITCKTAIIIIAVIIGLGAVLWSIRGALYSESNKLRRYVCDIPGLGKGFVPQGLGYSSDRDTFIMTGYKGDNAIMYLVKDNVPVQVYPADESGATLKGHAGGVTCTKDCVYIANEKSLWMYSFKALSESNGSAVKPIRVIPVDNKAAYVFSTENWLYVGEFYRPGNYETDPGHYYTTPAGDENKAIVSCYPLNESGEIAATYPAFCISVTGLVQGFAVQNGTYVLSRSYGLTNSKLEYYKGIKDSGRTVTARFENDPSIPQRDIPLLYLDSSNKVKTLTLPSFSEDLVIIGDRVAVTNESACNKYIVGKYFGATKVYSYPLDFA